MCLTMLRLPALAMALAAAPAMAQPPATAAPAALATYAASSDIQAMIARARRDIKPDAALMIQPLLRFQPYTAFLEYRRGNWSAAVHPDFEMFFVVQGTGRFVSGGQLVGAKPGANGNVSGTDIAGGTTRKVSPGDVFVVPAGVPHMFPKPDGELVLISMHLPSAAGS